MDLSYHVLIDCTSGTFFGADTAFLLDTRRMSDDILDVLNNGSDSERCDLAESSGQDLEVLMESTATVEAVARILWKDGHDTEWNADTVSAIAELIQSARPELVPPEGDCSHHPLSR